MTFPSSFCINSDVPSAIAAIAINPACRKRQSWLTSIPGIYWNAGGKTALPLRAMATLSRACS